MVSICLFPYPPAGPNNEFHKEISDAELLQLCQNNKIRGSDTHGSCINQFAFEVALALA